MEFADRGYEQIIFATRPAAISAVQGLGAYLTEGLLDGTKAAIDVPSGSAVCLGFDGSRSGDWTALRAVTMDGHRFTPTYGPDSRPTVWRPDEWPDGRIPRGEVNAAVADLFTRYRVARMYADPRHFETQIYAWASEHGEDTVVQWPTNSITGMFPALARYRVEMAEALSTHDDDPTYRSHALAARKVAKPGDKFILSKPSEHQKIDVLMADVLAYEARADSFHVAADAGETIGMQVPRHATPTVHDSTQTSGILPEPHPDSNHSARSLTALPCCVIPYQETHSIGPPATTCDTDTHDQFNTSSPEHRQACIGGNEIRPAAPAQRHLPAWGAERDSRQNQREEQRPAP